MTLIPKLDLDMVKMYHHTQNEVSMSRHSKVIAQKDTHTDRHTHRQHENITFPHTWAVTTQFRFKCVCQPQACRIIKSCITEISLSILDKKRLTCCSMYIPLCDHFGLTQQI